LKRTGTAVLPLHGGRAPAWLFQRMTALAGEIIEYMVIELGAAEILARFSDPRWFQAFGCLLGFDWHSSGLTTTTCGAVKEALRVRPHLGLFAAGGKGAVSRRTPQEIEAWTEKAGIRVDPGELVRASRLAARVDNNALQDGYQLYHHFFLFTSRGEWAVVQQGMNEAEATARRYHWLSSQAGDMVEEPHTAICSARKGLALDLTAKKSRSSREVMPQLAAERPGVLLRELERMKELSLPRRHTLYLRDIDPRYIHKALLETYERPPSDFLDLLERPGVGAKTLRALALVAELVHGTELSWEDPAVFSFAHGGKDGYPFPVDRKTYDASIEIMADAVRRSQLGPAEKGDALRRLQAYLSGISGPTPRRLGVPFRNPL